MEHIDHILVVDDDHGIRTGVVDYLRKNGLRATAAADGREMFAQLDASAFDLVVLDIMMPDVDGYQVLAHIRGNEKTRHIPVMFLTARSSAEDVARALRMGANHYMTKPFSTRELIARVRAHLRREEMGNDPTL